MHKVRRFLLHPSHYVDSVLGCLVFVSAKFWCVWIYTRHRNSSLGIFTFLHLGAEHNYSPQSTLFIAIKSLCTLWNRSSTPSWNFSSYDVLQAGFVDRQLFDFPPEKGKYLNELKSDEVPHIESVRVIEILHSFVWPKGGAGGSSNREGIHLG